LYAEPLVNKYSLHMTSQHHVHTKLSG